MANVIWEYIPFATVLFILRYKNIHKIIACYENTENVIMIRL